MPAVYCAPADVHAYVIDNPSVELPDDAAITRLIERAQRDIDRLCERWPILSTGLRFDPALLPVTSREALRRATCAQVEYIVAAEVGELVAEHDRVTAVPNGVSFAGEPPRRIGLRAVEELSGHGLITWSGCVAPDETDPSAI